MANLAVVLCQRGGDENVAEAERLWRRAAELGNTDGMLDLAVLLHQRGGDENVAEAERLYRRAVELGNTRAMANHEALLQERAARASLRERAPRAIAQSARGRRVGVVVQASPRRAERPPLRSADRPVSRVVASAVGAVLSRLARDGHGTSWSRRHEPGR